MGKLLVIWAAVGAAPTDEATLREGLEPDQVTPGLLGFLLTFFIVIVTFFLIRDMAKRIRRVRYRGEVMERAEQESAATEDAAAGEGVVAGKDPAAGEDTAARRAAGAGLTPPGGKHGPNSDLPDEKHRN